MTATYCQMTGKAFAAKDLKDSNGCYEDNRMMYCACHDKPLVESYPFIIKSVQRLSNIPEGPRAQCKNCINYNKITGRQGTCQIFFYEIRGKDGEIHRRCIRVQEYESCKRYEKK
jgi:hypothetical protein